MVDRDLSASLCVPVSPLLRFFLISTRFSILYFLHPSPLHSFTLHSKLNFSINPFHHRSHMMITITMTTACLVLNSNVQSKHSLFNYDDCSRISTTVCEHFHQTLHKTVSQYLSSFFSWTVTYAVTLQMNIQWKQHDERDIRHTIRWNS